MKTLSIPELIKIVNKFRDFKEGDKVYMKNPETNKFEKLVVFRKLTITELLNNEFKAKSNGKDI